MQLTLSVTVKGETNDTLQRLTGQGLHVSGLRVQGYAVWHEKRRVSFYSHVGTFIG